MIPFRQYISEGGNLKIGDISAQNINVTPKNRIQHQSDIHNMFSDLHDSFHKEHGEHLFGPNKKALNNSSIYSGSTKHLFNNDISHEEFAKHKPSIGDIDVKVPSEHMDKLHEHLQPGRKFGKYTVMGIKKGGVEHHVLVKHDNGNIHQVDFEKSDYHGGEPSKFDQFAHSSDWEDLKNGVKGVHHKQLLNATGTTNHKFSIYGLGNREGAANWEKDMDKITSNLFPGNPDNSKIHSFHGVVSLIKRHIPPENHQEIYNKFKDAVAKNKNVNNAPALDHMKQELSVKDQ